MITKEQAMELKIGNIIYELRLANADGSPVRWKVNGKCKLWKTRPNEFQLPIKHGLYDYEYIDEFTGKYYTLTEEEAISHGKKSETST